jgi:PucR family transcriptional regulator, purine catabolism regulatory protein
MSGAPPRAADGIRPGRTRSRHTAAQIGPPAMSDAIPTANFEPASIPSGFPTVAEVLALDPVRQGNPRVVAGAAGLDHRVRWVHVTELTEVREILRGGELVLSTAIAWPDDREALARYVADLAGLGAAGLVVELGRRYVDAPPKPLLLAAEKHRLPVITLGRDTRFVTITEAVHARIIDAQLAELRASEEVHQAFNELAVEGADPLEVVRQIAKMAGHPVVLENLAHQVLVYEVAGATAEALLDGWEGRSRAVRPGTRTAYDEHSGWLTTIVGARGQDWGRLVLICDGVPAPAPSRLTMLAERGASTLALNRLMQRDRESLERQTHRTLLTSILNHDHSAAEVSLRARAIGVGLDGKRLVGLVLRLRGSAQPTALENQARLRELTDCAAAAVREKRLSALIGSVDEHSVGLLLALGPQDREDAALGAFAAAVRKLGGPDGGEFAIAVGTSVGAVRDARRSLLEAVQVADAAIRQSGGPAYHRLVDVRLRGLLHLLRDDARMQTYVERELGPLLAYDTERGTNLVAMLGIYLDQGRNKSAAADAAHLSRPSFYERLHRIERVLGVDLDSVESCLSLHVALLALDAVRTP